MNVTSTSNLQVSILLEYIPPKCNKHDETQKKDTNWDDHCRSYHNYSIVPVNSE